MGLALSNCGFCSAPLVKKTTPPAEYAPSSDDPNRRRLPPIVATVGEDSV
jgi:hypothetical protein